MAARVNKKRAFLFVSKVLGKHIPVNPYVSLLSGAALSLLLFRELSGDNEQTAELLFETLNGLTRAKDAKKVYHKIQKSRLALPEPAKFIGFAETATALGHSMYNVFASGCTYIHTTRELIPSMTSLINFDEEHSHAVSHRCYAIDEDVMAGEETIVLVDDEITTGNTALNIIKDIQAKYPRKCYIVASLLDWRTTEDVQRYTELEQQLGITIKSLSLIKGTIEVKGKPIPSVPQERSSSVSDIPVTKFIYLSNLFELSSRESLNSEGYINSSPYIVGTGRFGIHQIDNRKTDLSVSAAAKKLVGYREGATVLCLGTGEFMYIPMRIAAEMGECVSYHSTTRSPIHSAYETNYAIRHGVSYPSPDQDGLANFVYNISLGQYEDLFLFLERDISLNRIEPMLDSFRTKGFKRINIVICGPQFH
ncbi:MAG: phosphoribosyltransferase family protein [Gorillibacterium sp.]|nr:phosphoribosyltransferase family protein [Gorillibacterium sp.]